jgi:hypothetical protein
MRVFADKNTRKSQNLTKKRPAIARQNPKNGVKKGVYLR